MSPSTPAAARVVKAGTAYFGAVFATGVLLGTIREAVVAPALGSEVAVLLELPLMLVLSWFASQWTVAYFRVPTTNAARINMGGLAFALLMGGELAIWSLASVRSVADGFRSFVNPTSILTLGAQLAFAFFPLVQLRREAAG